MDILKQSEIYDLFVECTHDENGEVDNNYFKFWLADLIESGEYGIVLCKQNRTLMVMKGSEVMDEYLESIAQEFLHIETLETRNSDELDFHEISVWGLKEALQQAFLTGRFKAEKFNG